MDCHPTTRSTIRKIVTTLLIFLPLAGGAILYGELQLRPSGMQGVFWRDGHGWWAPDEGQCARCGDTLVARIDPLGACRNCPRCNLSYRHPSLPATLAQQAEVWK
jgi:hypothetical protein